MCDIFICSDDGVGLCDADRTILQNLGRPDPDGDGGVVETEKKEAERGTGSDTPAQNDLNNNSSLKNKNSIIGAFKKTGEAENSVFFSTKTEN